jgi:hypothetical protein
MHSLGYHLKPYSECKIGTPCNQVRDNATNAKGAIIYVDEIKHLSNIKAVVLGGYYANGKAASGAEFTIELRNGKWIVTNIKHCWVA